MEAGVAMDDIWDEKGSHAVPKEEKVFAGMLLGDGLAKFDDVLGNPIPTVPFGEPAEVVIRCREAVATVVLRIYGDSKCVEVGGETMIAAAVFRHTVEDLQDRMDVSVFREPRTVVNLFVVRAGHSENFHGCPP